MSVPAWKRLGLKVKAVVNNDPLALVAPRVGDAEVDEQQQKSKTKVKTKATTDTKKRKVDGEDDDAEKSAVISKKPPKRVKLPKGEKKKLLGEHYAIRDITILTHVRPRQGELEVLQTETKLGH